jgi:hypothetical protein
VNARMAISAIILAVGSVSGPARSQSIAVQPSVRVRLIATATPIDGAAWQNGEASADLVPNKTARLGFALQDDLCSTSIGGGSVTRAAAQHAWTVDVTLLSAQVDRIALDVTIERHDGSPIDSTRRDARHLILAEDAPHVLDFIEAPGYSSRCTTRNIVLQLSAGIAGPSAFERSVLSYDLWLAHRDGAGHEWMRHTTLAGLQGERVAFRFDPLVWPVQALMPAAQPGFQFDEQIAGAIRARVVDAETIDISLTTRRDFVNSGPNGHWGSVGGEEGVKHFAVRSGETVSMELPAPAGEALLAVPDGSRVHVNYRELFGGHTSSLVVTVTRR